MVLRRFIVRERFAVLPGNPFIPGIYIYIYIGPPFVESYSPDFSLSMFTASYPSSCSGYFSSKAIHLAPPLSLPSLHFAAKYPYAWQIFVHILSCSEVKITSFLSIFLSSPPTFPFFHFCPFLPKAYVQNFPYSPQVLSFPRVYLLVRFCFSFWGFFPLFTSYKSQDGLKTAFSAAVALLQPSYLQCIIEAYEAKGRYHNL